MISSIGVFIAGLVALVGGAELLVRGASRIAEVLRVSPLIIGLTIVAFGTSFPELAVSMQSALGGNADIALGNVVGSNIFNVLFILGISAFIVPLMVSIQLVRFDVPIMIASSVMLLLMGLDGVIGRIDGLLLFGSLILYLTLIGKIELRKRNGASESVKNNSGSPSPVTSRSIPLTLAVQSLLIVTGLAILIAGSTLLIDASVAIARFLGVSELIIGLTIVAGGTSLPEAATSILAALRGQRDIAVGNIVGSNIFNILCIAGLTGLAAPGGIPVDPAALHFDIPFMTAVAFACLPVFFTGHMIARWEGALFFCYYILYIITLITTASGPSYSIPFKSAVYFFAVPLTVLTILISVIRQVRKH